MLRISDLRNKDVINCVDGKRLGFIRDIEIDVNKGGVEAIVIPGQTRLFALFARNDEIVLPWRQIKKIGVDVILVEPDNFTPTLRNLADDSRMIADKKPDLDDDIDFFAF